MDVSKVVVILALTIVGSCFAHENLTQVIREKRQSTHHCPGQAVIYYQDVDDCHAFFQCSQNQAVRHLCDGGMRYNPNTQTCQYMSTDPSGCGSNRGGSGGSDDVPEGTYHCARPDGRFQDTSNCRRYYSCSDNIARLVDCTGGRLFDPSNSRCANVQHPPGCTLPDVDTRDDEDDVENIVRSFTCRVRNGDYADEIDCSSFWNCQDWISTSMRCPDTQFFYEYTDSTGGCHEPTNGIYPPHCDMPYK